MSQSTRTYSKTFELRLMIDIAKNYMFEFAKLQAAVENIKKKLGEMRNKIDRNGGTLTDDLIRYCDFIIAAAKDDDTSCHGNLSTLEEFIEELRPRIDDEPSEWHKEVLQRAASLQISLLELLYGAFVKKDPRVSDQAFDLIQKIREWFLELSSD